MDKQKRPEKQNSGFDRIFFLGIIIFCILAYSFVIGPYLKNRDEGLSHFVFIEVPTNATLNSTVIHLEDKDIMNIRGLEVNQENGKLRSILFRQPSIHPLEFRDLYGSRAGDPGSRKYLEYKGVYYYGILEIP